MAAQQRRVLFDLSVRSLVTMVIAVAAAWFLVLVWPILLVILVALILVGTLNPMVRWLEHLGVKRSPALALIFLWMILSMALIGLLTIPPLVRQIADIVRDAPNIRERLATTLDGVPLLSSLGDSVRNFSLGDANASAAFATAFTWSKRAAVAVGIIITVIFLAFYFISDRERLRGALFSLVPRRYHIRLARISLNLETIVGGYVRGQIITSLAIAVFTFAFLSILRVPNALALAVIAGVTDMLPLVGGIMAVVPATLMALSRGVPIAIAVAVVLTVYQELENRVLVPRVYGRVLRLPSAVIIIAILLGAQLLGVIGALLAIPVAAAIRMMIMESGIALPGESAPDDAVSERNLAAENTYQALSAGVPAREAAQIAIDIASKVRQEGAAKSAPH